MKYENFEGKEVEWCELTPEEQAAHNSQALRMYYQQYGGMRK